MLFLDDDDVLPSSPDEAESALAARLGEAGVRAVDANLVRSAGPRWLKVARVASDAMDAGEYDVWDDSHVRLHVRRIAVLVDAGELEAQGNLHRPRFSEVRRPCGDQRS